jgi:hypothetical protein
MLSFDRIRTVDFQPHLGESGTFDPFLGPISASADGVRYEAVFN